MIWRLLRETLWHRKGRVAIAVLAVMVGITLATALLSISADITTKMSQELRSYGANIVVTPRSERVEIDVAGARYAPPAEASYIDERELPKIKTIFWRNNIVGFAPYLSIPVRVVGDKPITVVLTGTWFENEVTLPKGVAIRTDFAEKIQMKEGITFRTGNRAISPWWQVRGDWPKDMATNSILVGSALARRLNLKTGDTILVEYESQQVPLRVTGLLTSGGFEDDQLIGPLPLAQNLLGVPHAVGRLLVSARVLPKDQLAADIKNKKPEEMTPQEYEKWYCSPIVEAVAKQVEEAISGSQARPILQIAEAEGAFLGKIQWLMVLITLFALLVSALGVMATMNASVLERRGEIGLMKAVGAQNVQVAAIFLSEAATIGLGGGLLGYFLGSALARFMGEKVFNAAISPSGAVLPVALLLALAISIVGSGLPIRQAVKVEPVILLRGQ